jgi:hypothetical protein
MGFAEHYATPVGARLGTNSPRTDALKGSLNSRNALVFSATNRQVAKPRLAAAICGAGASSGRADRSGLIPQHVWLERIPFRWNRNSLCFSLSDRIFCGEPVSTPGSSPRACFAGNALEHCEGYLQHPMKQRTRITVRVAAERQSNPWLA